MRHVRNSVMLALALVLVMSFVSGCATDPSNAPPPPCPEIVDYSNEELAQAADELDMLPAGAIVERMVADYGRMRDQVKAVCQ